ncbi:MAG: TIGR01777 family oxidoreductase [Actinomycetota bacterium]|nr:TIGR01777 family oxidoreductase [Actinomycetota bacterium]
MDTTPKVAVTGASGFIGRALVTDLEGAGHDVLRLVRREPAAPSEVRWDPRGGTVDTAALAGVEAVFHLAGAGIGDHRWTSAYKREILDSRVIGTRTLAAALAGMVTPPRVLVSSSGISYYGDTGNTVVDESSPKGASFLADVSAAWEEAADPARAAGIRVVHARTSVVAGRGGGAFARLAPLARLGVAGRMGSGRQFWSLISLADCVRAMRFVAETDAASGPVNLVAVAARNADVVAALAAAYHRPAVLPVPALAMRVGLGEMATEVLDSVRAQPSKLRKLGFRFEHPDLAAIAAYVAGRARVTGRAS